MHPHDRHTKPQTPYEPPKDEIEPEGTWEFDEKVAEVFDDMLSRSIPQYEVMRESVTDLASRFLSKELSERRGRVVDLGASRGEALAPLVEIYRRAVEYHAVEVSPPMLEALRRRWPHEEVTVHDLDLREGYPTLLGPADVTLAILTIQFTPIEHRQRILRDVWRHTRDGGAFILVEKVLGHTADIDGLMKRLYFDLKGKNGYSPEQIERKRLSLEGVLVPVTAKWNEDLLRAAGFAEIDCIWRWQNFAGWLAIK